MKKEKRRIWDETIRWIHAHWEGPITARELATEKGTSDAASLQILRRLRSWGYMRLAHFANTGLPGRPAHAFVITDKGVKRANWRRK